MTLPTLILAFALATVYGAGFHLWQGGGSRRLLLYLLAGWLGFALGHFVGEWLGLAFLRLGGLNAFTATLGSMVALFAARFLALKENAAAKP
jgi:uncharacterized membrane protein YeaQ/YmgE (transglycosylase-associated protein family)